MPKVPKVPKMPKVPKVPKVTKVTKVPKVPTVPKVFNVVKVPKVPKVQYCKPRQTIADHGRPKHSDIRGAASISDAFIAINDVCVLAGPSPKSNPALSKRSFHCDNIDSS